jgi:hypothetical protein
VCRDAGDYAVWFYGIQLILKHLQARSGGGGGGSAGAGGWAAAGGGGGGQAARQEEPLNRISGGRALTRTQVGMKRGCLEGWGEVLCATQMTGHAPGMLCYVAMVCQPSGVICYIAPVC